MSYKRVVEKRGKKYGPYIYESYRDENGRVRKRYLGKVEKNKKISLYTLFIVGVFVLIFIIGFSYTTDIFYFNKGASQSISTFFSGIPYVFTGLIVGENVSDNFNDVILGNVFSQEGFVQNISDVEEFINESESGILIQDLDNVIFSNQTVLNESIFEEEQALVNVLYNGEIAPENIGSNSGNVSILQYKAVIGRPVKWLKKIDVVNNSNISIEIPKNSDNISVLTDEEIDRAEKEIKEYNTIVKEADRESVVRGDLITGSVASDIKKNKNWLTLFFDWIGGLEISGNIVLEDELDSEGNIVDLNNLTVVDVSEIVEETNAEQIAVEYYTEAPVANEINLADGKRVIVSAPSELNYSEILAYTLIDSQVPVNDDSLDIYWYENIEEYGNLSDEVSELLSGASPEGVRKKVEYVSYDFDEDGFVDYVEWVVPHLSVQVYDVVIRISGAEHLDENRNFIEDVYNETSVLDDVWASVNDSEYIRVVFESELDSSRDITIYASGENSRVDVYRKDGDEVLASFENINDAGFYKIYLSELDGVESVFDLRAVGLVEFDYIIDPINSIEFVSPTPDNNTVTTSPVGINVSILGDLDSFVWNWNGTNYTLFNDSIVVYMNFDNRSALGENDTVFKDISRRNATGICGNGNCPDWNISGRYGGAYLFNGGSTNGDRIDVPIPLYNYTDFTYSVWINSVNNSVSFNCILDLDFHEQYIGISDGNYTLYGRCSGTFNNVSNNRWHHLVWTVSGPSYSVYEDGVLIGSGGGCSDYNEASYMSIGARNNSATNGFNGRIDEVIFLNRSVSSSEVQMLYMSGLTKIGEDSYLAYINQSKNATNVLDRGSYIYRAFATDDADSPGEWNSTEEGRNVIIGESCYNCSDCSAKVQNASAGDVVFLSADVLNQSGDCVVFNGKDNVTFDCNGFDIQGDGDWDGVGIYLNDSSNNNTIRDCGNISGFNYGIFISGSNNNIIINVTVIENSPNGVLLSSSDFNVINNSNLSDNSRYGIEFSNSENNIARNLTLIENEWFDVRILADNDGECNNQFSNLSISGGRPFGYYNSSVNIQDEIFSELTLCNADNSSLNNITVIGSDNIGNSGFRMIRTEGSNISNINSSNNRFGLVILKSSNNKIENITVKSNEDSGIYFWELCNNNNLTNINSSGNDYGVYFYQGDNLNNRISNSYLYDNSVYGIRIGFSGTSYSLNNTFYNNFFNNTVNLNSTSDSNQNFWNISKILGTNIIGGAYLGGNFWTNPSGTGWSDNCTDGNGDGICDSEYVVAVNNTDWLALTENAAPIINVISPTNTTYGVNSIYINATASEAISSWIANWNGTNVTITINTTRTIEDGVHHLFLYGNDSFGNWGMNDSIWFSVDTTAPSVRMIYPTNTTYALAPTQLNFSVSDINLYSCWYSIGFGQNITTSCSANITGVPSSEGLNTWTIYANDSVGNENQSSVTFLVDTTAPTITFVYPANNSYFYDNYTGYINVTVNESGGNCSFNDTRWDYSSGNTTFFSFKNNTAFSSNETIRLNVSCWDSLSNNGSSILVFVFNVSSSVNSAPILGSIDNPIFVCEGETLNYEFNATDADNDDLTEDVYPTNNLFYSNSLGRVGNLSSFNIISGVLDKADVGDYEETISVSDPDMLVDSANVNITVIEINNPPMMTGLGAQTVWLIGDNSSFYHQMNVSDTESVLGEFSFNLTWGASEDLFDINSSSGAMNYTPVLGHVGGPYGITVCVQDEGLVSPHPNISLCSPSTGNA